MKNPLLSAAVIVLAFWWIVLTVAFGDGSLFDVDMQEVGITAAFIGFGVMVGGLAIVAFGFLNRSALKARLASKSLRGLTVTMGMLPILKREAKRANTLPNVRRLNIPDITNPSFVDEWRLRWKESHPAHVAVLDAVLQVLMAQADAPASHIADGHGGRTLLQHSLLVSFMMAKQAQTWEWKGSRSQNGNRPVLIHLRNSTYCFNPDDPLVLLVAVAHDIGKLECYIYSKTGEIIGSRHEHDIASSQMLGRMPEIWALPDADREALLLAVGHYHHMPDMPMETKDRPLDDRLMALAELLIHADAVASKLELGASLVEAEAVADDTGPSEAKQDTLLTVFFDIVNETGRINGNDTTYRVGQKTTIDGKKYLFFHERGLLGRIAERSGLDANAKMGSGEFRLTRELLIALDEKGALYKTHAGKEYGPVSALFRVEFRKLNGDFLAEWPATIIVEITETFLPAFLEFEDADVIPLIMGPLLGQQRAKKGNTGLDLEALTAMDAEKMLEQVALQPGTPKPPKNGAPATPPAAEAPPVAADDTAPSVAAAGVAAAAEEVPEWAQETPVTPPAGETPPSTGEGVLPPAGEVPEWAQETSAPPAPEPIAEPVAAPLPNLTQAGTADNASSEALLVCELILAGALPKAAPHPEEEGVFVIRATHLTPLAAGFTWADAVGVISAGLVPGVRCVTAGAGEATVLMLLFNPKAVLANQGSATAFTQTGEMPVLDRVEVDRVEVDPF